MENRAKYKTQQHESKFPVIYSTLIIQQNIIYLKNHRITEGDLEHVALRGLKLAQNVPPLLNKLISTSKILQRLLDSVTGRELEMSDVRSIGRSEGEPG